MPLPRWLWGKRLGLPRILSGLPPLQDYPPVVGQAPRLPWLPSHGRRSAYPTKKTKNENRYAPVRRQLLIFVHSRGRAALLRGQV